MKVFQAEENREPATFTPTSMSAGEIIDRAARLYRRHGVVLIKIVLLPSLVSYCGSILITVGLTGGLSPSDEVVSGELSGLSVLMVMAGVLTYVVGKAALYAILGGASRSLFNHFFDGSALAASEILGAVRERIGALLRSIVLIVLVILGFGILVWFVLGLTMAIGLGIHTVLLKSLPMWLQITAGVIFGLILLAGLLLVGLLILSRVICVPQVVMVEGKSASEAIGRSFSLAGGEWRRIGVMVLFLIYAAWSLWILLTLPLIWYGIEAGIPVIPFETTEAAGEAPLWFRISQQTVSQISEILIAPIIVVGFTLLYFDIRVRREGFDVEMLANRILPPVASVPTWRGPESTPPGPVLTVSRAVRLRPAESGQGVTKAAETETGSGKAIDSPWQPAPANCPRCGALVFSNDNICGTCGWRP